MPIARFVPKQLSYDNRQYAVNEEVVVDDLLGDFYIKTPEGHLISDEEVARMKAELLKSNLVASQNDTNGQVYQVDTLVQRKPITLPSGTSNEVHLMSEAFTENMDHGVSINIIQDAVKLQNEVALPVYFKPDVEIVYDYETPIDRDLDVLYNQVLTTGSISSVEYIPNMDAFIVGYVDDPNRSFEIIKVSGASVKILESRIVPLRCEHVSVWYDNVNTIIVGGEGKVAVYSIIEDQIQQDVITDPAKTGPIEILHVRLVRYNHFVYSYKMLGDVSNLPSAYKMSINKIVHGEITETFNDHMDTYVKQLRLTNNFDVVVNAKAVIVGEFKANGSFEGGAYGLGEKPTIINAVGNYPFIYVVHEDYTVTRINLEGNTPETIVNAVTSPHPITHLMISPVNRQVVGINGDASNNFLVFGEDESGHFVYKQTYSNIRFTDLKHGPQILIGGKHTALFGDKRISVYRRSKAVLNRKVTASGVSLPYRMLKPEHGYERIVSLNQISLVGTSDLVHFVHGIILTV